jgi:hypothetical protein
VFVEKLVPASRLAPPFKLTDEGGKSIPCQWEQSGDGNIVRFVVMDIAEGQSPTFTLDHAAAAPSEKSGITINDVGGGSISISNADHESPATTWGRWRQKFKKPFFYPVMAQGVSVTRAWPMEDKPNEARTIIRITPGFISRMGGSGKEYWSVLPITPKSLKTAAGPVYGHLMIENAGRRTCWSRRIFLFSTPGMMW